jgi:hypothetical protein
VKKGKKHDENLTTLEKLLGFVEKDRVGIFGAFIIISVMAYLRSIGECTLFNYVSTSTYIRAVHEALYFALFMTGTFLVTWISGINGRKIFNVILFGWWIILLPPIIDYMLGYGIAGGKGVWGYPYPHNPDFIGQLLDFFNPDYIVKIGIGEMTQLYLVTILPGIYVYLRKRSAIRAFLSSLAILLYIDFIASAMNFIKDISSSGNTTYIVIFQSIRQTIYGDYYLGLVNDGIPISPTSQVAFLIQQQIYVFVIFYYSVMFLISSYLFMRVYKKDRAIYFMRSVKWLRIFATAGIVLLGFAIPRLMVLFGIITHCPIYPEYFLHMSYIGVALLAAISAAQAWNMMEDLNSEKEWDAPYTKKQYRNLMIMVIVFSLGMSYILGDGVLLLDIAFLMSAYIYSYKPFEAMKTSLRPFVLGLYALFPFLMAYYTPSWWLIKIWGPHYRVYDPSMVAEIRVPVAHPLYPTIIASIVLIYVSAVILIMLHEKSKNRR